MSGFIGLSNAENKERNVYYPVKYASGGASWTNINATAGVKCDASLEGGLINAGIPSNVKGIKHFYILFAEASGVGGDATGLTVAYVNIQRAIEGYSLNSTNTQVDINNIGSYVGYQMFFVDIGNDVESYLNSYGDLGNNNVHLGIKVEYAGAFPILVIGILAVYEVM